MDLCVCTSVSAPPEKPNVEPTLTSLAQLLHQRVFHVTTRQQRYTLGIFIPIGKMSLISIPNPDLCVAWQVFRGHLFIPCFPKCSSMLGCFVSLVACVLRELGKVWVCWLHYLLQNGWGLVPYVRLQLDILISKVFSYHLLNHWVITTAKLHNLSERQLSVLLDSFICTFTSAELFAVLRLVKLQSFWMRNFELQRKFQITVKIPAIVHLPHGGDLASEEKCYLRYYVPLSMGAF